MTPDMPSVPLPATISPDTIERLEALKANKMESVAALEARVRQEESDKTAARHSALQQQIDAAKEAEAKAKAHSDQLAENLAERDVLRAEAAQARASAAEQKEIANDLNNQAKCLNATINREREEAVQLKLYWLTGILGGLTLVGIGIGVWIPLLRTMAWRFAMASGAVALTALLFAWIIPYLLWLVGALALSALAVGIYFWRLDHHTSRQLINAMEAAKADWPDYADHMAKHLDSYVENHVLALLEDKENKGNTRK